MPEISILMGAYNCEDTIYRCVESIINQTFTDWEFIICDDGSDDQTWTLLNELSEKDNRIKLIKNKKNMKLSYTLNRCLKMASGRYCARMDSDDQCDSNRLSVEYNFLENNSEYGFVSTTMKCFDEQGIFNDGTGQISRSPTLIDYIKGSPFCHAPVMIRTSAYKIIGGYLDMPYTQGVEDYDLWFRLYAADIKGFIIADPLYSMYDGRAASKRRTWKRRINEFKVRKLGYELLHVPLIWRVYAFKPLLLGILPKYLYIFIHKLSTRF